MPFLWVGLGLVLLGGIHATRFVGHLRASRELGRHTRKFEQYPPAPTGSILIAGDSIAVGVGASQPSASIAGLFGREFPKAEVVNVGVSGAETQALESQLQPMIGQHFLLVVIIVGANDVVHFTDLRTSEAELTKALKLSRTLSEHVVLFFEGNVGNAPLWPRVVSLLFTQRSHDLRQRFMAIATTNQTLFVDIFKERSSDPWRKNQAHFYAADLWHPADRGYADWYTAIQDQIVAAGIKIE